MHSCEKVFAATWFAQNSMAEENHSAEKQPASEDNNDNNSNSVVRQTVLFLQKNKVISLDNICLVVTTVFLLVVFIISGLAAVQDASRFGFKNSTADVSNSFFLQTTPAGWTFAIWGIIYTWQALWLLYAWSFPFRPSTPRTISWIVLLLYTSNNINIIIWLYVWGNNRTDISFAFVLLTAVFLWAGVIVETVHLYKLAPTMNTELKSKIDLWISRLLVTNGLVIYATWVTIATLLNFGIVLQYFANVTPITTGVVVQWLLTLVIVGYFTLENTILDRFARFIFMFYPVLIWALSGVLSAHWGQENPNTNPLLTLLLLLLAIILFITRGILVTVFFLFRPLYPLQAPVQPRADEV